MNSNINNNILKLPIVLGWKPKEYIRIDKIPFLKGKFAIHFHLNESLENAHLKLEYGKTPYCLSLFVFKISEFYKNNKVKVRSYDLWPKSILFNASIGKYDLDKKEIKILKQKEGYRPDAVIVDWGYYTLNNSKIYFRFLSRALKLKYEIKFYRELRYRSPKYGPSIRSEYIFLPIL